jgi:hypothetical protein
MSGILIGYVSGLLTPVAVMLALGLVDSWKTSRYGYGYELVRLPESVWCKVYFEVPGPVPKVIGKPIIRFKRRRAIARGEYREITTEEQWTRIIAPARGARP